MVYKWCVVPQCTNTSINTPQKLFVSVPTNPKRRKMWLKLARRDPNNVSCHSNVFMCEDHFDNQDSSGNEIKVFCPKCNTEVPHTAEGIQEDQTKILIAKVYHYFVQEYEELKKMYGDLDLTPLSRFQQRTALATGVSETTVLQILKEEEGRNADKRQELLKKRRIARKRSRQLDSSSKEDSSDDNVDDGGQSSFVQLVQKEPEIETLVVKLEPLEGYDESTKASTAEVQTITSRKKTNAQKCREYRERKKLQNKMVQNITAERSDECSETDQLPAKKPKTNAERRKKHYEAQKLKKQATKKIPKTAKQRNKEYYYRKKKKQALNSLNHHSDAEQPQTDPISIEVKAEPPDDDVNNAQQSPQWSQNVIIDTGHNQDQLNTRHTINFVVINKKKERQQRYREQNREKLKQREAERRKRRQYIQSIAGPSTTSNINTIELNNEEIIAAISQSSSGLQGTQTLSIQKNEQAKENNATQKQIIMYSANETLALNEPAGTKRIAREIPRSDVIFTQQHSHGESSTTAAASNVQLTEQLHESGLLGVTEIKLEIEIGEEGFS